MEDHEQKTLSRTKENLLKNLDKINDFVEANGFPIEDHMILDDIKDSVKSLVGIKECMGETGNAAKVHPVAVTGAV